MDLVEFSRLTSELRAQLEGDEEDPFGEAGSTLQYRSKERHVALRGDDGRLIASTGMLVTEVEVEAQSFPVVGIGGVIVNARHRGQGLARRIVSSALERAVSLGPEFALLFCREDRSGLYRKLGFSAVHHDVFVGQPDGYVPMSHMSMWRALHDGARWPRGRVVVQGLPF